MMVTLLMAFAFQNWVKKEGKDRSIVVELIMIGVNWKLVLMMDHMNTSLCLVGIGYFCI